MPVRSNRLVVAALLGLCLVTSGTLQAQAPAKPKSPSLPFPSSAGPGPQLIPDLVPLAVDPSRPSDIAYSAYQSGFYLRAFREATKRVAENPDDGAAMVLLGELYRQGLGQPLDLVKAAEWYKLAQSRGDANGGFALAMATFRGEGVAKNQDEAEKLLRAAAGKGHPQAAYNLALALMGSDSDANRAEARTLLELAAARNIPEAQHALAVMLQDDKNGPPDLKRQDVGRAAQLMAAAAQLYYEPAEIGYAIMLFNGQGVDADQITAADIFTRTAWRGNAIAQNRIARIFATGRGRTRDPVEASAWHIAAAAQGLADSELDKILSQLTQEERAASVKLATQRMTVSQSGSLTQLLR
jgi:uncharacterized protein